MPVSIQSALHAAGIQAARVESLWWLMFWVCAAVYVAIVVGLGFAVVRGAAGRDVGTPSTTLGRRVGVFVGISTIALLILLAASVVTGRAVGSLPGPEALGMQVTGYQWWWGVEYLNPDPSQRVTTANEIHLPVGRTVAITLQAADVIHSFWVPNLSGKIDLIPGHQNVIWLRADRPGVYRGQCAEFCGVQHAHMALTVVVESSDDFERWLSGQRQLAPSPASAQQMRGLNVVERGPCAMCHTIRGTSAGARLGPDLTHVATRSTIGAGTVPNTPGFLAGWIANPQHVKPGNRMPPTGLSADDLQAVIAYLETLR